MDKKQRYDSITDAAYKHIKKLKLYCYHSAAGIESSIYAFLITVHKEVIYNSDNHMINPQCACAMRVTVVAGAQACLRCIDYSVTEHLCIHVHACYLHMESSSN